MLGWLRRHPRKTKRLADRTVDTVTEIGLLLVVFGPLDTIFGAESAEAWKGWTVFGVGMVLIVGAAVFQWSLPDDD